MTFLCKCRFYRFEGHGISVYAAVTVKLFIDGKMVDGITPRGFTSMVYLSGRIDEKTVEARISGSL